LREIAAEVGEGQHDDQAWRRSNGRRRRCLRQCAGARREAAVKIPSRAGGNYDESNDSTAQQRLLG
jgi:hypothetical protein